MGSLGSLLFRTRLPAPTFTRSDFSLWGILKKCVGLVSWAVGRAVGSYGEAGRALTCGGGGGGLDLGGRPACGATCSLVGCLL